MNNDRFRIGKNVRFAVVSFLINIFLVFLGYRFVIRYGGLEAVGLWATLLSLTQLIRIGDVGMGSATLRFVATCDINSDTRKLNEYIDTAVVSNSIFLLILSLVGYYSIFLNIDYFVSENHRSQAVSILPIMVAGFFLSNLGGVIQGVMQGLHLGYVNSLVSVFGNCIQIVLIVFLVPEHGLVGLAVSQLVQYFVILVVGVFCVSIKLKRKSLRSNFSFDKLKEILSFSLRSQVANVLNGLFEPLSKIIFGRLAGMEVVGILELAYKTVALPRNAVAAGLMATVPSITKIISEDVSSAIFLYKKMQKKVVIYIGVILFCVVVFSPVVSYFWIGNFNQVYWIYVLLISGGFFFNTVGAASYNLGIATGNLKNNIISSFLTNFVMLISSFFLWHFFKNYGLVFSIALGLASGGIFIKYTNEKVLIKMGGHNE